MFLGKLTRSENEFNEKVVNEFLSCLTSVNSIANRLELDLRDNGFKDHHIQPIADFIKRHSNLKELCIWMPCNYLTDKGVIRIIEVLDGLLNLTSLVLNFEWLAYKEL